MIDTIQFQLLLATFAAWANRQQASVIAYLIEENRVLKEQLESGGKRLRFTDDQRRRLAAKGKPLGRKALRIGASWSIRHQGEWWRLRNGRRAGWLGRPRVRL